MSEPIPPELQIDIGAPRIIDSTFFDQFMYLYSHGKGKSNNTYYPNCNRDTENYYQVCPFLFNLYLKQLPEVVTFLLLENKYHPHLIIGGLPFF